MCETRALEHSYSSFTRRSDPSHSSTRALVLELEHSIARTRALQYSYSTRTRIRAIEHRTRRYYNYIHARTGTYKLHARTHMAHAWALQTPATYTGYVQYHCSGLAIKRFSLLATQTFLQCSNFVIIDRYETLSHCTSDQMTGSLHLRYSLPLAIAWAIAGV